MSATTDKRPPELPDEFFDWLGSPMVRVVASYDHRYGQWEALAEDYRVASMGPTEVAAIRDLEGLLTARLLAYYEKGIAWEKTLRPQPRRRKLWNALRSIVARAAHQRRPFPVVEIAQIFIDRPRSRARAI